MLGILYYKVNERDILTIYWEESAGLCLPIPDELYEEEDSDLARGWGGEDIYRREVWGGGFEIPNG